MTQTDKQPDKIRKYTKPASKAAAPIKKVGGVPSCTHSGKDYSDLNHSERLNQSFVCGDCGTRFLLSLEDSKKAVVLVPKHVIPAALHEMRKTLEKNEKTETKRVR